MFKTKRTALALVGVLSLVLVLLFVVACPAAPVVTVTPTSVAQNGTVTVAGSNYQSGETVTIKIGTVTLNTATVTVGTDGKFSAAGLTVPTTVPAGAATVTVTGSKTTTAATAALTVTAAPK